MKIDVLGVGFDDCTLPQAVARGGEYLQDGGFHYAVTPNPEFILAARKDGEFLSLLNGADLVLPDGIGVVYAAKILGAPLGGRVTGIDFATGMLDELQNRGGRLFLLGAKPGVGEQAAEHIAARYPGLTICGIHHGYFKPEEETEIAGIVTAAQPDLIFVCLGAPRQEKWIARWGAATGCKLAIGLGGAMDVFAGVAERAPERWRRLGLEWAYRLVKEPQRIGRMSKLPLVLIYAMRDKLSGKGRG